MANVLLVIDMLRGFLEPQGALYCGDESRSIIPKISQLLQREAANGSHVVFVCDNHEPNDPEFEMFAPHCVAGTQEAEIIPELASLSGLVVPKYTFSAFVGTRLDETLRELQPDRTIICGVCTSICVLFTVYDVRLRGYQVDVYADCVADFDPEAHGFSLRHMQKVLGARLLELD
ncbi:MAG: cysteine hydrolase [Chloroflexi bacterium]|nr:cysteine hydrolase [Chloroflexota bacterium]